VVQAILHLEIHVWCRFCRRVLKEHLGLLVLLVIQELQVLLVNQELQEHQVLLEIQEPQVPKGTQEPQGIQELLAQQEPQEQLELRGFLDPPYPLDHGIYPLMAMILLAG